MSHLFISHRRSDGGKAADELVAHLEAAGLPCWIAPRDVIPGEHFARQITRAIRASRALVLLLTPGANDSPSVINEVDCAHTEHKRIVPLIVDSTPPCDDLIFYVRALQHIPWTDARATAAVLRAVFEPAGPAGVLLRPPSLAALPPGTVFKDGEDCLEMVRVPAGRFQMGSPEDEEGRNDNEGPVHTVTIAYALAVSRYPVTRGQWRQYLLATGQKGSRNAFGVNLSTLKWERKPEYSWENPGYEQQDDHPVVCITWEEAQAYTQWLSRKTGQSYRLLSEAEYEFVSRAGRTTVYFWGNDAAGATLYANGADASLRARLPAWESECMSHDDGHPFTSPVGSFQPNDFCLFDTTGNVWCWTGDLWHDSYHGAPTDGSAWVTGKEGGRVVRGSSWYDKPCWLRSAARYSFDSADDNVGFRVARTGS